MAYKVRVDVNCVMASRCTFFHLPKRPPLGFPQQASSTMNIGRPDALQCDGLRAAVCWSEQINPLKPELNPICYLLALLGAHHFLHVSRTRVKLLIFRLLMPYIYIYGAPILDVSRSHTTTRHSR